jgi:hypothetical protein
LPIPYGRTLLPVFRAPQTLIEGDTLRRELATELPHRIRGRDLKDWRKVGERCSGQAPHTPSSSVPFFSNPAFSPLILAR